MKGLILAGGYATRLRPLSCSKPKLLFPMVGVPLIDHMVSWFNRGGVKEVLLAVNHLSETLKMELGGRRRGSKIIFSVEERPLGTGGPVKLASSILGKKQPFIVANGDIVSNIDLRSVVKAHLESEADATVVLMSVTDPRDYGSASLDSQGRITEFREKTGAKKGKSWINAGVYVLNPSVVNLIPNRRKVSLEREVFPELAENLRMHGWKHRGFWYDIGKVGDYIRANREVLKNLGPDAFGRRSKTILGNRVRRPYYVSRNAVVHKTAKIGPYAILSDRVRVDRGAVVRNSIIFEETRIGENCVVDDSIIGERVNIGQKTTIGKGSIVAGEINIANSTTIRPGSTVLN
jgi:mannose-1-phosphate guanylyltransferase/phosphomannomutase